MLRLVAIAGLLALLGGCIQAEVDATTSLADRLPDLSGVYDLAVGPELADEMDQPPGGAIMRLTREGNHYILRAEARDGSGAPPRDERLLIAGTPEQLVVAYSAAAGSQQMGVYPARILPDGTLEVLTATQGIRDTPGEALQRSLAGHGYEAGKRSFALELSGPSDLAALGAVLWDPAVRAVLAPKVMFVLTPEPD